MRSSPIERPEWYEAVHYTVENDWMIGVSAAGDYASDGMVTRASLCQVLYNIEGRPPLGTGSTADGSERMWYADAVDWAASQNIQGAAGTFADDDHAISRGEAVQILRSYFAGKGINASLSEEGSEGTSFTRADLAVLLFNCTK